MSLCISRHPNCFKEKKKKKRNGEHSKTGALFARADVCCPARRAMKRRRIAGMFTCGADRVRFAAVIHTCMEASRWRTRERSANECSCLLGRPAGGTPDNLRPESRMSGRRKSKHKNTAPLVRWPIEAPASLVRRPSLWIAPTLGRNVGAQLKGTLALAGCSPCGPQRPAPWSGPASTCTRFRRAGESRLWLP